MFQFTPFARYGLCIQPSVSEHDPTLVALFGNLRIKACLAAPRSFSQPSTPFFAGRRQGIHRLLLVAWPQILKETFRLSLSVGQNQRCASYSIRLSDNLRAYGRIRPAVQPYEPSRFEKILYHRAGLISVLRRVSCWWR